MSTPSNAHIQEQVSLKPYNTFGIDVIAGYWVEIFHPDDVARLLDTDQYHRYPHFILGGGSNVLFPKDYHGIIIKISIPGVNVISEDEHHVVVRAGAGVVWDELVRYCLDSGWGGLENLSMIPGLTGAAPIQNIGAYGVELKDSVVSVDTIDVKSGQVESFDKEMCRFEYRNSIFKQTHKGRYLITGVTLKLDKKPQVNISYEPLKAMMSKTGVEHPTIEEVSRAVRAIRSSKLPDPSVTGNAGSFFKNPVVTGNRFAAIQDVYPDMPGYPVDGQPSHIKIPAAWLIEKCGFKGMRDGDAGVHEHHALILVNHGQATGDQLLGIARNIKETVIEKFGITLEPEVNIVTSDSG